MLTLDTIVAIASPPGAAVRGIIRLSGHQAFEIGSRLFHAPGAPLSPELPGFSRIPGHVYLSPDVSIPAALYRFRSPKSYTGLDCVEVHTVGSPPILEMLVYQAVALGARQALPGEFTAQAYYNGRMDLLQAEAVAAVIRAQSDAQLRAARTLLNGEQSRRIAAWHEELADLTALIEAEIDFTEEDIHFITPNELRLRLTALAGQLVSLLSRTRDFARHEQLPRVLLLGLPNAGKSSIMNALTGLDRSICSPMAGTTRDVLSAPMRTGSLEVLVLDAAGVDQAEEVEILRMARDAALELADEVEAVCVVIDGAADDLPPRFLTSNTGGSARRLILLNKIDLLTPGEIERRTGQLAQTTGLPVVPISALTGQGIADAKEAIQEVLQADGLYSSSPSHVSARQEPALSEAHEAMMAAVGVCESSADGTVPMELMALHLREALSALEELTGEVTTEDLLGRVFSKFCIGK